MVLIRTQQIQETLTGIASATTSQVVDLDTKGGAKTISCQSNITVTTPTPEVFDSEAFAELEVQDLTYTAVDAGTDGNDITIEYVGDGVSGAETVNVTDTAIVVHMDPTAVTGSTADDILAAVEASLPASALVTVDVTGTGSNVQATAVETPLAGGMNEAVNIDPVNTINITGTDFVTGLKVRLTTTGTLPSPFLTATDYFVILIDANTIALASTLNNALAGTKIVITDDGAGVHTATATALAGATVVWQFSNDALNWVNNASPTSITTSTSYFVSQVDPAYRYAQVAFAITAGSLNADNFILVRANVD